MTRRQTKKNKTHHSPNSPSHSTSTQTPLIPFISPHNYPNTHNSNISLYPIMLHYTYTHSKVKVNKTIQLQNTHNEEFTKNNNLKLTKIKIKRFKL